MDQIQKHHSENQLIKLSPTVKLLECSFRLLRLYLTPQLSNTRKLQLIKYESYLDANVKYLLQGRNVTPKLEKETRSAMEHSQIRKWRVMMLVGTREIEARIFLKRETFLNT